ncbi:unnamed protein product [Brugia timori]|uniref:Uncharacterized protein n=1 Tax=Brugia timori TaxID=42155 RepID=A0A0R3QII1_9BILA|nr:unnamed protein product [Brugia timori]
MNGLQKVMYDYVQDILNCLAATAGLFERSCRVVPYVQGSDKIPRLDVSKPMVLAVLFWLSFLR